MEAWQSSKALAFLNISCYEDSASIILMRIYSDIVRVCFRGVPPAASLFLAVHRDIAAHFRLLYAEHIHLDGRADCPDLFRVFPVFVRTVP